MDNKEITLSEQDKRIQVALIDLLNHDLSFYFITFYMKMNTRQAALMVTEKHLLVKITKGRPKQIFAELTKQEQLPVVKMFYEGHEIIQISKDLDININRIFKFLCFDDLTFGYRMCPCGQPFVYIEVVPPGYHCMSCQKKEYDRENILHVDFCLTKIPEERNAFNFDRFNRRHNAIMAERIIDIRYLRYLKEESNKLNHQMYTSVVEVTNKHFIKPEGCIKDCQPYFACMGELKSKFDELRAKYIPSIAVKGKGKQQAVQTVKKLR